MKILVQVALEFDPDLNLRVDRRTGVVKPEEGDQLYRVWPLGRLGIQASLNLPDAEVTAFSVGHDHDRALRHALAAGAHRAVALTCKDDVSPGALAAWIKTEAADLVISDRRAGSVAWRLGWAHLAGLSELSVDQRRLSAIRHLGRGNRQRVTAPLPALVRLHSGVRRPPYISRTRIQQIEDNAWEVHTLPPQADPHLEPGPLQPARARTKGAQRKTRSSSSANDRAKALMGLATSAGSAENKPQATPSEQTPESMAQEFVRYLKHHDLLNRRKPCPNSQPSSAP